MKLAIIILTALTSLAVAAPKTYSDAKISINLPDKWKVKDGKNGVTMVGAPAGDAGLLVFSTTSPTADGVKKSVDDLLAGMKVTGLKWGEIGKTTVNTLPAFGRLATGVDEKKTAMDVGVMLVVNDKAGLVVIAIIDARKMDGYKKEVDATLASIAAVK